MWGSNARETHPIFFHHVLKALHRGAKVIAVDPRRTTTAQWGYRHLPLTIGSDIALANAMAREIIESGLINERFIRNATTGFDEFRASVERYTLAEGERLTGIEAGLIREVAHLYARADRAIICWTLGITEHHTAVDNVLSLINLALLTGHVGRHASGLNPLRGQNNVQGGGDMGAIPNRFVGFQDILDPAICEKFSRAWGVPQKNVYGKTLTQMFEAMDRGEMRSVFVIGENPVQSEADQHHARRLMESLDHLVVFDLFMTKTAELAHVVLPAAAGWCESEGTVTNSERRVQRVRKALVPPGEAREEIPVLCEIARRMGIDWGSPSSQAVWDEIRTLAPEMFGGMTYARLDHERGLRWPCADEGDPGATFLHGRLWEEPRRGKPAPFSVVEHDPPIEQADAEYPYVLTTGRRLSDYNTGIQSGLFDSPLRRGETVDMHPHDATALGLRTGDPVRVSSRRGSVVAPAFIDPNMQTGVVFMTFHFQDEVSVNQLTIDATDPKAGTAEFKACAVKLEPV